MGHKELKSLKTQKAMKLVTNILDKGFLKLHVLSDDVCLDFASYQILMTFGVSFSITCETVLWVSLQVFYGCPFVYLTGLD